MPMKCPNCGNTQTILEAVTFDGYECRLELGGCGSEFDAPIDASPIELSESVHEAINNMVEAIRSFENQDFPLGEPSMVDLQNTTIELLEVLKRELGRLTSSVGLP